MEKKSYGILMQKNKVNENVCFFRPLHIISGKDTGEDFEDEVNNCYTYSTNSDYFVLCDSDLSVAYILSEAELRNRYEGVSIEEAMMAYFSDILESIHIGYYMDVEDTVVLKAYSVEEIFERLFEKNDGVARDSKEEAQKSVGFLRMQRPKSEEQEDILEEELIPITATDFKKILEIREDEKLRNILQTMYTQYQEGYLPVTVPIDESEIYPSLEGQEITGKKIISFFASICNRMLKASSMEEISKLETNFKNGFMKAILILDTHGNDEMAVSAAEETLYKILDEVAMITACRDLAIVKKDIAEVFKTESSEVERVAALYDEYAEKFKRNMEEMAESIKHVEEKTSVGKINARSLKEFFDRRIAGQEDAKRTIISAVVMNSLSEAGDRISCFLVGPPGSGKTLIAETLGEYLDIPYEIIDTTQLTVPGYIGRDIEDFLARLIRKAGGDVEKAERGIVVFNELDKKGSDKKSDVSGQGVLNCLLSFFEGTTYQLKKGRETVDFNTSKLTIFATGACADVAKAKLHKEGLGFYKKTKIGFEGDLSDSKEEEDFEYPKLEPEDFSKYGGIPPEIIGRITTICQLSGHTTESLKFILTNVETSALVRLKATLAKMGIDLTWTEDYLSAVAHKAMKLKTGARSLKSTVEQSVKEARWEVLVNPGRYSGILLNAQCVENPLECQLVDREGRLLTVNEATSFTEETNEKVKKIGTKS